MAMPRSTQSISTEAIGLALRSCRATDVVNAMLACKAFSQLGLLQAWSRDVCRGQERVPISCDNTVDNERCPSDFIYQAFETDAVELHFPGTGCHHGSGCGLGTGCHPGTRCNPVTGYHEDECSKQAGKGEGQKCSCSQQGGELNYTCDGRLKSLVEDLPMPLFIQECGPACLCPPCCANRRTQAGISCPLVLKKLPGKGWAVCTSQPTPQGTFICNYSGQYISTSEALFRHKGYEKGGPIAEGGPGKHGHALLTVREVLPSGLALRVNIDATLEGNVSRFINHSCDGGNLEQVVIHRSGCMLPSVALFAKYDLPADHELLFSYGPPNPGPRSSQGEAGHKRCACGTDACLGFLPVER
eukprot:gene10293-8217_t